jgi:hypothetical protein
MSGKVEIIKSADELRNTTIPSTPLSASVHVLVSPQVQARERRGWGWIHHAAKLLDSQLAYAIMAANILR